MDLLATKILTIRTRTEAKDYIDIATIISKGLSPQKGFEAAYAIVKLNGYKETDCQLDVVKKFLMTDGIKSRIENCNVNAFRPMASKTALILARAAGHVKMERVYKTELAACIDIEKGGDDNELGL